MSKIKPIEPKILPIGRVPDPKKWRKPSPGEIDRRNKDRLDCKSNRVANRNNAMLLANQFHEKADKSLGAFLKYAKKCGDALRAARKAHNQHGTWMEYVRVNFAASYETACHYIRISADWNLPAVVKARDEGNISSIAKFIALTRSSTDLTSGGTDPNLPTPTPADEMRKDVLDFLVNDLKRYLTIRRLKRLSRQQLESLYDNRDLISEVALAKIKYLLLPEHLRSIVDFAREEETREAEYTMGELDDDAGAGYSINWRRPDEVDKWRQRFIDSEKQLFAPLAQRLVELNLDEAS